MEWFGQLSHMKEEQRKKIAKILREMQCSRGCKCLGREPEDLCKVKSFGVHSLLECLEDVPENCTFSVAFGGSYFCKCPARLKIAEILEEN